MHKFNVQKWSRFAHRYLSFFFAGMIIVYAISGLVMNHRDSINPYHKVEQKQFSVGDKTLYEKQNITKNTILELLDSLDEGGKYTHHFYPEPQRLKIFLKGGSSILVDTQSGIADYERLSKKIIIGGMVKLHYDPSLWWTIFSDVFVVSLIVIVISGFFMIPTKKLRSPKVIIPTVLGLIIPILFLFFLS